MKKAFWIVVLLAAISCSKDVEVPDHILQPQEMANVLIDIHIEHAKVQSLTGINQDSAKVLFRYFELEIFDRHNVQEELYYESYNFYLDHPDMMLEIYTSVVDSLSLKESLN